MMRPRRTLNVPLLRKIIKQHAKVAAHITAFIKQHAPRARKAVRA